MLIRHGDYQRKSIRPEALQLIDLDSTFFKAAFCVISRDDRHERPVAYWQLIADLWRSIGFSHTAASLAGSVSISAWIISIRFFRAFSPHGQGASGLGLPRRTFRRQHPAHRGGADRHARVPASAGAVARVLKEAGYVIEELPIKPHPDHVRSFERVAPNRLGQTDLFTFILKRQNRRLYLVAFKDDHSRFITGYGLHTSQSASLALEVFRAAVSFCSPPREMLTDNGAQYVT